VILDLTLQDALAVCCHDHKLDSLVVHLLCATPVNETWAVVNLRSPVSVAFAIGTSTLTPVAIIGQIELASCLECQDLKGLESVLVDLLSKRSHSGITISIIDALNILDDQTTQEPSSDGV